jgi:hypothetical protein
LRRIIQQDETGCGVACVAIFANVGYDDARKVMFGRARGTYTSTADLRRALCRFGFKPARRLIPFGRRGRYTDLREDAVLKLKARAHGEREWHWAVWDARRRKLIDPAKFPYKRFRVTSFLAVRPHRTGFIRPGQKTSAGDGADLSAAASR